MEIGDWRLGIGDWGLEIGGLTSVSGLLSVVFRPPSTANLPAEHGVGDVLEAQEVAIIIQFDGNEINAPVHFN